MATVSTRIDDEVHTILKQHGEDCGRSIGSESRLWLTFGAIAATFSTLIAPGVEKTMTDEKLAALREEATSDMASALVRCLPHRVDPEAVVQALAPRVSMN